MSLTLKNFRAISMPQTDVIHVGDDGRIAATATPGARVIDCGGAYLSPGWCDLHVHDHIGNTVIFLPDQFRIGPAIHDQIKRALPILRPRLPVGAASHVMAGSNQIASEPRRLSALLYAGQFRVL